MSRAQSQHSRARRGCPRPAPSAAGSRFRAGFLSSGCSHFHSHKPGAKVLGGDASLPSACFPRSQPSPVFSRSSLLSEVLPPNLLPEYPPRAQGPRGCRDGFPVTEWHANHRPLGRVGARSRARAGGARESVGALAQAERTAAAPQVRTPSGRKGETPSESSLEGTART